jgi:hypothetical protein
MSLLLGLPYGIPDQHCDLELKGPMADPAKSPVAFLVGISRLGGKVIDRCQGHTPPTLSSALDIEGELDALAAKIPPSWWDISPLLLNSHIKETSVELRERLLSQIAFHHIRVYLHLPFMLQSATNPRYEYSRKTCLDSSREVLRLYHILRTGNGEPLYECKAVDFLGFTAAMLVLLGLLGYGRVNGTHDVKQDEQDWRLIDITMDILQRASDEVGGNVAKQSYKVLEQLSAVRNHDGSDDTEEHSEKIAIPYFGTISIKRGKRYTSIPNPSPNTASSSVRAAATPPSTVSSSSPRTTHNMPPATRHLSQASSLGSTCTSNSVPALTPQSSSAASSHSTSPAQPFLQDPFIAYDGFYNMNTSLDQSGQALGKEDGLMSLPANASWNNTGMGGMPMAGFGASQMDIDQDWSMFLGTGTGAEQAMGLQPDQQGEYPLMQNQVSFWG